MLTSVSSTSSMVSQLFSKLDTKSQGYLELSDLQAAYGAISGSDSSSVSTVFTALDSDSDGKVSESEFSSTLSKLQETLDGQFNQMRMQGMGGHGPQGMAGMPPPPPPENDSGFTQEELQSQLDQLGTSDSQRASLISNIVSNFAAADSDGDGKVNFQEARAYDESSKLSGSSGTAATTTAAATGNDNLKLMQRIMQLMHAYGASNANDGSAASQLATSA